MDDNNNYQELKQEISNVIRENGTRSITGEILKAILLEMVDQLGNASQSEPKSETEYLPKDGGVLNGALTIDDSNGLTVKNGSDLGRVYVDSVDFDLNIESSNYKNVFINHNVSIASDNFYVDSESTFNGNSTFNGHISVAGNSTFNGNITIAIDSTIGRDLNVTRNLSVGGTSTLNGNTTINGDLIIGDQEENKTLNVIGDFTVGYDGANMFIELFGLTVAHGNIEVHGSVDATAFNQTSDIRLKKNIEDVLIDTKDIASMPAVSFNFVNDGNRRVGTIAQAWQEILPQVVTKKEDGFLQMDYGSAAVVSCIVMAREIEALKEEIMTMKGQIKNLEFTMTKKN